MKKLNLFTQLLMIIVFFSSCEKDEMKDNSEILKWTIYNKYNSEIVGEKVQDMALENDSCIWIATESGASKFNGNTWTNYTQNNSGLADYIVTSVMVDKKNRKWFGGLWTISMLYDTTWVHYGEDVGLDNSLSVVDIAVDNLDNKWFATPHGLLKYDGLKWSVFKSDISFFSIIVDSMGNKWCGTQGKGVFLFDDKKWTVYDINNSKLINNYIQDIGIDKEGNKWFVTNGGICLFNGIDWINYLDYYGKNIYAHTVAVDRLGNVWFGGMEGIIRFDGNNWTNYNFINSDFELRNNDITSIVVDKNDNLWFGTYGGGIMKLEIF